MSCLKAGHILSNGLKITIFYFSSVVNVNQIWNTGRNWSFVILQRQHVCTASYSYRVKILVTGFLFKRFIMANFNPVIDIRRRRFKAARANICRWRMLYNAYKPIRFCTLNKLNREWRNVANKTSTSLMSKNYIWRSFRAWNIKSWQSGFKYHLCRACATSMTPVV